MHQQAAHHFSALSMPKPHSYITVTTGISSHPRRGLPPSQGSCLWKGDAILPGMDLAIKKSSMLLPSQAGTGTNTPANLIPTALGFSRPGGFRFAALRPGSAKRPCHHPWEKG